METLYLKFIRIGKCCLTIRVSSSSMLMWELYVFTCSMCCVANHTSSNFTSFLAYKEYLKIGLENTWGLVKRQYLPFPLTKITDFHPTHALTFGIIVVNHTWMKLYLLLTHWIIFYHVTDRWVELRLICVNCQRQSTDSVGCRMSLKKRSGWKWLMLWTFLNWYVSMLW